MATPSDISFSTLAPLISLYTPPSYQKGQLIIICTWLGAQDKHISKYITFHRTHFPHSKILLLKASFESFITSYSAQQSALEPATQVVLALLNECRFSENEPGKQQWETAPRIMVHILSSGGANNVTNLLLALRHELKRPIPVVGIVCDSAPAGGGYWKGHKALTTSLPKAFPLNIVGAMLCHILLGIVYINVAVGRYDIPEDRWRDLILDEELHVDANGKKRRIAYITSKKDRITYWEDVRSHAEEAKRKGWVVKEILYEDTPHCNHLSKDEGAYLDAVLGVWERSKL